MSIPYPTIYKHLKDVLSVLAQISKTQFDAGSKLIDDLRLDYEDTRDLAPKLNDAFRQWNLSITREETSGCETVRCVARLIDGKLNPEGV